MATLSTDRFALTILLGFLTALGPLSTDLYLPSLPSIARHFDVASGQAQLTLSAYLIGFATGLPLYGPVSDRIGRKKVVLFGLALYGCANLISAMAPSLEVLIASRGLQGLGAAAPLVVARAMVRDLHEGRRAAQELARMGTIMGVVPAIAPILGVGLELGFGWRSNFVATALLAAGLAAVVVSALPETLRQRATTPLTIFTVVGGFGALLRDRRFLPFALLAAACYSGLFAFISGSSFVYQQHFRLTPFLFAVSFVVMVLGYMAGAFLAQRLALRYDQRRMLLTGALLQSGGGLAMVAGLLLGFGPAAITLPMVAYAAGVGFTLPQSHAGAMMHFPERAGAASSLLGVIQMGFAAVVGAQVGAWIDKGPMVLAGAVAVLGLASVALLPLVRRS
ncbi:multidrug effflux MFS transporter [Rhabdaerophilum sp. SD176]|uniref:multidrug effflux MFS transporter n=1 Tax=Rhabdaerophilum sp. SD176 TaxID=2983548 RepID=UPI0024E03C7A|nr:multidrug effflux MFS transporter [Rhabdaerophilum sp. SD176]